MAFGFFAAHDPTSPSTLPVLSSRDEGALLLRLDAVSATVGPKPPVAAPVPLEAAFPAASNIDGPEASPAIIPPIVSLAVPPPPEAPLPAPKDEPSKCPASPIAAPVTPLFAMSPMFVPGVMPAPIALPAPATNGANGPVNGAAISDPTLNQLPTSPRNALTEDFLP